MMRRILDVKEDDELVMKKVLASCNEKSGPNGNDENKIIHSHRNTSNSRSKTDDVKKYQHTSQDDSDFFSGRK